MVTIVGHQTVVQRNWEGGGTQTALFSRNGRETLQLFGVDDGEVKAGLGRVIKEDGIDYLARRGRQAEGDVRDTENGLDEWNFFLDQPDGFDGFDRAAASAL